MSELVELLTAHQIDSVVRDGQRLWYCICDHVEDYDDSVHEHPAHVASVLTDAGFGDLAAERERVAAEIEAVAAGIQHGYEEPVFVDAALVARRRWPARA